jgi:hypothetical protein
MTVKEDCPMRQLSSRRSRLGVAIGGVLLLLCLARPAAKDASAAAAPALRAVASFEVPAEPSTATDVRWAGDRSVYLARQLDGVAELRLGRGLPRVRQVTPSRETLGPGKYLFFSRLAASEGYLAWAEYSGPLAWRSLARTADRNVRVDWKSLAYTEDLDLAGDRLLVLGALWEDPAEYRNFSPDGAIAFLGSALETGQQTLRPVLFDTAGPGALHILHCGGKLALGAARFLADGSFFILPGFQPGATLFSRDGRVLRTWNTALLGLDADADCASMSMDEAVALGQHQELRTTWLNRHRIVDEVLPLAAGPGVVIRTVTAGTVRWELDVLGASGISTFDIPVTARSPRVRLRGDYRNGMIVFLETEEGGHTALEKAPSRLLVMELPKG